MGTRCAPANTLPLPPSLPASFPSSTPTPLRFCENPVITAFGSTEEAYWNEDPRYGRIVESKEGAVERGKGVYWWMV